MSYRNQAKKQHGWSKLGRLLGFHNKALSDAKVEYDGSCHCGRVRFKVNTRLDHVKACDCSICRTRGALIHRVEEGDLQLLTPLEDLSTYKFHTEVATDYFCPTCGILPFRRPRLAPQKWAVNVRCLAGVDLDAIPVERARGSLLP